MKKNLINENRGITLIAMIITIIVMLVLAGVSMNAIIGDNGILSNAINATTATSISVLQEYLQELYVENYDNDAITKASSAVVGLSNISAYSGYFYNPKTDSGVGALSYVVDSEGHVLYLIKKSGLPEDIQKQLVGGDAGDGTYSDYASLNDVYGVTSDLDVYYCSSGLNTIQGITSADLDNDDPLRKIFEADSTWANLLSSSYKDSDGNVTAQSIRSVTSLTIDSSVTSLAELYNFTSLKELTIDGATLSNLDGIQNATSLNYLCFTNYGTSGSISDYSAIKYTTKLEYLYLTYSNDTQVNSVFTAMAGTDYSKLKYLGVYNGTSNVTNIDSLDNLSSTTKQTIKYLYLYNNKLTSLSSLEDFINVYELRVYSNSTLTSLAGIENLTSLYNLYCYNCSITTLSELKNMNNLYRLEAYSCNLGASEVYDSSNTKTYGQNSDTDSLSSLSGLSNLNYVDLHSNSNLRWVSYLSADSTIKYLYLKSDEKIADLSTLKSILKSCADYTIPSSLSLAILDDDTIKLDLSGQTLKLNDFRNLYSYTKIYALNLDGITLLTEDSDDSNQIEIDSDDYNTEINYVLGNLVNMQYLDLDNLSYLSNIEFVKNMSSLKELRLNKTNVNISDDDTGLELLNNYCDNLSCISLNTLDSVDLSKLQNMLNKTYNGPDWYWNSKRGFYSTNSTTLASFEKCTSITQLYLDGSMSISIDLTSCSSLLYLNVSSEGSTGSIELSLPSNLETIFWHYTRSLPDISKCTNLTSVKINCYSVIGAYSVSIDEFLYNLGNNKNLQSLIIMCSNTDFGDLDLSNLKNCTSLTTLEIYYYWGSSGKVYNTINTLENLKDLTSLTNLRISDSSLSTLDGLESLTNLQTLTLSYNCIRDLKPLESLTNLVTLDLRYNCIWDTSTYTDDDGNDVTYYNLDILANLNKEHSLTTVYLLGNEDYIMDWSPVSSINGWKSSSYSGW